METMLFAQRLSEEAANSDPMLDRLATRLVESTIRQMVHLAPLLEREGTPVSQFLKDEYVKLLKDVIQAVPSDMKIEATPDIIESLQRFAATDRTLLDRVKSTFRHPVWMREAEIGGDIA